MWPRNVLSSYGIIHCPHQLCDDAIELQRIVKLAYSDVAGYNERRIVRLWKHRRVWNKKTFMVIAVSRPKISNKPWNIWCQFHSGNKSINWPLFVWLTQAKCESRSKGLCCERSIFVQRKTGGMFEPRLELVDYNRAYFMGGAVSCLIYLEDLWWATACRLLILIRNQVRFLAGEIRKELNFYSSYRSRRASFM